MFVFFLPLPVQASQAVIDDEDISFVSESELETDLFDQYNQIMPGDELVSSIDITNRSSQNLRIYLKAVAHDQDNPLFHETDETIETMEDFLSQLHLEIRNEEDILFSGPPSNPTGMIDLGVLDKNETLHLQTTLHVPANLSNTYASRFGEMDWVYVAKQDTNKTTNPISTAAKTGSFYFLIGISAFTLYRLIKKAR
jgi:hypothetical protein